MQSPPFARYLVPPRSKYSPQHHALKHPQLPLLPQYQDQVSHPYKTTGKIIVLYEFVHVQRMAEGRLPKIALRWMSKQKTTRGRPKKNWMESIRKAMNERNQN